MGERSPHNDPDARGTFIGMTMDTSRADMTQAVLEGVAFALRDSFENCKIPRHPNRPDEDLRRRCKEPSLEKDYCQCVECESGRSGNRRGTRLRSGDFSGGCLWRVRICGRSSAEALKVVDTVEPDAELAAKYEERYAQFKQIYPTVKELFGKLK